MDSKSTVPLRKKCRFLPLITRFSEQETALLVDDYLWNTITLNMECREE